VTEQAAPLSAFLRPNLPEAALHGLPGEVAVTLAEATEADPAALLMIFLTMFGNAVGPQPHAQFGSAAQPARLFAVLVGDAATGRKGTAYATVEAVFQEADPAWSDGRLLFGLQSAEAMIDRVADGQSDDCRLLVVETEFGRLAETMARTGTLSAQLRNAYDGRRMQRVLRDRGKSQQASHAHVSLLGMITPGELLRHHARLRAAGGLESRLLYVYTARTRGTSPFGVGGVTAGLAGQVRQALTDCREAVMLRTDPISRHLLARRGIQPDVILPVADEVRDGWAGIRRQLPVVDHDLGAFFERAETQVIRLAAGYALADQAREIGTNHIRAALALWQYCARSAEIVFGVPVAQLPPRLNPRTVAKIFRHLYGRYPGWVPRDEIGTQLLGGNTPAAEVEAMLADLASKDLIEQRRVSTGGRPREECRLLTRTNPVTPYPLRGETPWT
jgi:hypothetical protein